MDSLKILQGFRDIADNQAMLHEMAMVCSHRMNMNGLKRLHRAKSKKFHAYCLELENCAQDYGMELKLNMPKITFDAKDLKAHLTKMVELLEVEINELRKLNFAAVQAFGMEFKPGVGMQKCLAHIWMKMKFRWIPRFEFTKWSPEDIVEWDKWLHDKCRCEEEHDGSQHCPHCHQHK